MYTFTGGKYSIAQAQAQYVLSTAYQHLNISVTFKLIDRDLALQQANSAKSDGEIARIATIDRHYPNLVKVPTPITSIELIVISKEGAPPIDSFEALSKHTFGLLHGSKLMERRSHAPQKALYHSYDALFKALKNDTITYILIQKKTAINYIKLHHIKNIQMASKTLANIELYHWINKKNAALVPLISAELNRMQNNGEIRYLQQKFLLNLLTQ